MNSFTVCFNFALKQVNLSVTLKGLDVEDVFSYAKDILKDNWGGTAIIVNNVTGTELAIIDL